MAYNIKSIKKEFAEKGIFYTQPELANYVKSFLPADVKEVYDPTCGNGGLLSVFDDDVEKYGQEINAEQLADAEKYLSNFHGVCGDTLKNPAWIDRKFDYIVANPPFGIKWEPPKMDMFDSDPRFEGVPAMPSRGMADFAFMLHILYLLSETGVAVVLDSHKDDDYLFLSLQGNQLTERTVNSTLHSLGKKANVRKEILHPHAFRHYFAIKMLKATNNDISLVSSFLGHSKISTTAIYTMRTLKEQEKALSRMMNW